MEIGILTKWNGNSVFKNRTNAEKEEAKQFIKRFPPWCLKILIIIEAKQNSDTLESKVSVQEEYDFGNYFNIINSDYRRNIKNFFSNL